MASETESREDTRMDAEPGAEPGEVAPRSISIVTQYTKDLSFENPRAPESLIQENAQPHGEVAIQLKTRALGSDNYEVVIEFDVKATQDGEVAFIVELAYGGVFNLAGIDERLRDIAVMVECPRMLFPFARRIVADAVRDGGFTPLMLAPVDFLGLYHRRNEGAAAGNGG
ncbi:MAG: protein-export chaperone SecB [Alphaproteobacteria bacterium]